MALANVAVLLAKWGHSVLIVDWDLEAPGIKRFFIKLELKPNGNRHQHANLPNPWHSQWPPLHRGRRSRRPVAPSPQLHPSTKLQKEVH